MKMALMTATMLTSLTAFAANTATTSTPINSNQQQFGIPSTGANNTWGGTGAPSTTGTMDQSGSVTNSSGTMGTPPATSSTSTMTTPSTSTSQVGMSDTTSPIQSNANLTLNHVRDAQVALNREVSSNLAADGFFGAKSGAAVRQFQSQEGLPVTGQLDQATLDALGVDTDDIERAPASIDSSVPAVDGAAPVR